MADIRSASPQPARAGGNSPEKRPLRVAGRIPPQVNAYYKKVSNAYKGCAIALLLLLVLFFLMMTVFFGDYMTYENVRYLVRDFGAMMSSDDGGTGFAPVVYNGSDSMKFDTFKNGLAAASGDKYLYYDATGIRMIEEDSGCSEPVLVPADKYLLLYDLGGTGYSVYNQLTRIIRRTAENPILCGSMSDSGAFLLVTRSRETRYVVEVYNSAFTHTMRIYKENYVLDAALSPDGTNIMIASAVPDSTDFRCEVAFCRVGQSEASATLYYEHTMPLDVCATEDGFILLCDTALYFYGFDGTLQTSVSLAGTALSYADMNDHSVAVVGNVNALGMESRVLVLAPSGEILLDTVLQETRVTGVEASMNPEKALVYLETPEGILQIGADGEQNLYDAGDASVIGLVPVRNGAIICTKTSAYAAFAE